MRTLLSVLLAVAAWFVAVHVVQYLAVQWFSMMLAGYYGFAFCWRFVLLFIVHMVAFFSTAFVSLAVAVLIGRDLRVVMLVLCALNFIFMIKALMVDFTGWPSWFSAAAFLAATITCWTLRLLASASGTD